MDILDDLHQLSRLLELRGEINFPIIGSDDGDPTEYPSSSSIDHISSGINALCLKFDSIERCEEVLVSLSCNPEDLPNVYPETYSDSDVMVLLNVFDNLCRLCMKSLEFGM